MAIKVKAIEVGFYGDVLRKPGTDTESFTIESEKQLGSWMEKVEPQKPAPSNNNGAR